MLAHVATVSNLTKKVREGTLEEKARHLQKTLTENPEAISSLVEDVRKFAVADLVDPTASDSDEEEAAATDTESKPAAAEAQENKGIAIDIGTMMTSAMDKLKNGQGMEAALLSAVEDLQVQMGGAPAEEPESGE